MLPKRYTLEIVLGAALLFMTGCVGFCLYFGHPADYAWLPACPLRVWTGLLCPGCGTLRATHYFLQGQFAVAFWCQPLVFILSPFLVLFAGKALHENLRQKPVHIPFEVPLYWLIFIVICLFFVLRNIPLDCFDCLRPPERWSE